MGNFRLENKRYICFQMELNISIDNLRFKLNEASLSYQHLLRQTHDKALEQNEVQTKQWQNYKKEHEDLKSRLLTFREKLSHPIMVPLGTKALMKGSLVHTNEILVCLGDGWFTKQSAHQAAEICQRRLQHCDEMLKKLQKEEELLSTRKNFTLDNEAFGADKTQEVIEPYDEEAEKQWRERHRQKEKEYRRKLAELRKNQNTKIETEEDLWSKLDALDLQEELEDEYNRMDVGGKAESEDSESDESESNDESSSGESTEGIQVKKNQVLQRRVSFKEEKENDRIVEDEDSNKSDDSLIRIVFNHSDTKPNISDSGGEITTPADIYTKYIKQKMPKSILKPSTSEELSGLEALENASDTRKKQIEERIQPPELVVTAVGEVVERTTDTVSQQISEQNKCVAPSASASVSRFKAARMASKR